MESMGPQQRRPPLDSTLMTNSHLGSSSDNSPMSLSSSSSSGRLSTHQSLLAHSASQPTSCGPTVPNSRTLPQALNNRGHPSTSRETRQYVSWTTLPPPRQKPRSASLPVLPSFPLPPRPSSLPSFEVFTARWTSHYVRIAPHIILYHLVSFYLPSRGNGPAFGDGADLELARQTAESALAAINTDPDAASVAAHRPSRSTILACARLLGVRTSIVEAGFTFYRRVAVTQRLDTAEGWICLHPDGPRGHLALRIAEDSELLKACARAVNVQSRVASRVVRGCGNFCGRMLQVATDRSPPRTNRPDLTLSRQVVAIKARVESWMREVCGKVCAVTVKGQLACAFEARELMHGRKRSAVLVLGGQQKEDVVVNVAAVRTLDAKCEDQLRMVHWIPSGTLSVRSEKRIDRFDRRRGGNGSVDVVGRTPNYGQAERGATG